MKKNKNIVAIIVIISVIFLGTNLYEKLSYQISNVFYKYGPTPRLFNDQQIYINTSFEIIRKRKNELTRKKYILLIRIWIFSLLAHFALASEGGRRSFSVDLILKISVLALLQASENLED